MTTQTHEPVRAVQRALSLLRVMNEREVWTLEALQAKTALPKSTVHRLLATLQAEHYVYSGEEMYGRYRLTHTVRNLSQGVTEKNRLADVARPILIAATKKLKWPFAVGVIDHHVVRANVCTMAYSPYATRPTCLGQSYDLFTTALGNAYLAFCDSAERRILVTLAGGCRLDVLRQMIRATRSKGYGLRAGREHDETSAIAVPIFDGSNDLIGVLACSTFSASLAPEWLAKVVPAARDAAREIGIQLRS